jgi:hypothetical protein
LLRLYAYRQRSKIETTSTASGLSWHRDNLVLQVELQQRRWTMDFSTPSLARALQHWRQSSAAASRAEADNFVFEERVGAARQSFFEDYAEEADTGLALRRRHADYYQEHVTVIGVPHTFQRALLPAELARTDEHQNVVRIEALQRPLEALGWSLSELRSAFDQKNHATLDKFCAVWDTIRDSRPSFGAFEAELFDEIAAENWPCRLRDRLGLAHYDARGAPVAVALMKYSVGEVLAALEDSEGACAFTVPTVLDSGPWPYFFPAPAKLPYGRAMPLAPIESEDLLLAEILHCRLSYKRHHLAAIGEIVTPLGDLDVRELRNHHLTALRLAADDEAFGEEMP